MPMPAVDRQGFVKSQVSLELPHLRAKLEMLGRPDSRRLFGLHLRQCGGTPRAPNHTVDKPAVAEDWGQPEEDRGEINDPRNFFFFFTYTGLHNVFTFLNFFKAI
jgi:hypothetical protein